MPGGSALLVSGRQSVLTVGHRRFSVSYVSCLGTAPSLQGGADTKTITFLGGGVLGVVVAKRGERPLVPFLLPFRVRCGPRGVYTAEEI